MSAMRMGSGLVSVALIALSATAACGGGESGGGGGVGAIDGGAGNGGGGTTGTGATGTGATGTGATNTGATGGGTSTDCQTASDCVAYLPAVSPAGCAEAVCDTVLGKCLFRAKDADGDGHATANCVASGGETIESGDDCDDTDPNTYPGSWDGPADGSNPDRCDTKDQDCDGNTDDDKTGAGTSCGCDPTKPPKCSEDDLGSTIPGLDSSKDGVGECKLGIRECLNGVPGKCNGAQGPVPETCDGKDNDCAGGIDNGNPGGGGSCTTGLLGVCGAGTNQCENGKIVCKQTTAKSNEVCDGQDNDCDGAADDGLTSQTTCGVGECKRTVNDCQNGKPQTCTPGPSSKELCDNKDNDCDGVKDDGDPGGGGSCSTGKMGVCGSGIKHCISGALTCKQTTQPSVESCNNQVDDDCDGAVNEGCPCARITLYNVAVGGQYPTSDPSGDKIGPYDANSSPCTIAASPLHDAAAQIKIEPYPNVCKPGDHVILYDYDNCGGVVFSTGFSCTSTSRFNLNYWNAADKAGAWKIKCSTQ